MAATLIINDRIFETRVALLENDNLVEVYVERGNNAVLVGNIYKGVIIKVLPGMQSAFIDIGMEKAAFLHVSDINQIPDDIELSKKKEPDISKILKANQHIIVQVSKEPIGTKGPRVTTNISLPGRFLVLMPVSGNVGVSRRIENEDERARLRDILEKTARDNEYGIIARTASEGASEKQLRKDYDFLVRKWKEISKKQKKTAARGLVHIEMDVSHRVIRDILSSDTKSIVVDNRDTKKELLKYLGKYEAKSEIHVELYEEEAPIFEAFGIEHEIARSLERKVWLKSGGYIVIDQAEALVAIDVNTGRYVGTKNLEDTILNTNLEAAKEIAYQLRLRNLGGIIILDFIDMEKKENRDKV
ncbi:MAG: Rne/Rng family ribonuclease, partial [Oligoflexia bacterium]|nr:Rne/Rng family ribonuclease [Oligoflexia bacterium]